MLATGARVSRSQTVLALESSCDDTAAAVLKRKASGETVILASVVKGQDSLHAAFGGVVPEIAARAHAEVLDYCVEEALQTAQTDLSEIDAIAVTMEKLSRTEVDKIDLSGDSFKSIWSDALQLQEGAAQHSRNIDRITQQLTRYLSESGDQRIHSALERSLLAIREHVDALNLASTEFCDRSAELSCEELS